MARTKRRAVRQRPNKPTQLAWADEAFADMFRLGRGWTPPTTVQVRKTVKGYTLVAIFRDDEKRPVRLTTRIKLLDGGKSLAITDEQLALSFRIGGRG